MAWFKSAGRYSIKLSGSPTPRRNGSGSGPDRSKVRWSMMLGPLWIPGDAAEINVGENSPKQPHAAQVGAVQARAAQVRTGQVCVAEASAAQAGAAKVGTAQVGVL